MMKTFTWSAAAVLACGLISAPGAARAQSSNPAAAPAAAAAPAPVRRARPERNRIRFEEIQESTASTVFQLIQSRRGMWLMRNQPTDISGTGEGKMLVFVDGAQMEGGVDDLKQLPLAGIRTIEFLSPGETEHKLGRYSVIGAIRVLTRDETPADSARSAHRR